MKLGTKTVLIFLMATVCLVGAEHTISYTLVLNSYLSLEQRDVNQTVDQVQGALVNQYTTMDSKLGDWSIWDDSYQFVQDNNTAFSQINLVPIQFVTFDLNYILYFNSSGSYVDGMGYNLEKGNVAPVPPSLLTQITTDTRLWSFHSVNASVAGVVLTQAGPLLVASRPIVTSSNHGPIQGALIFGRYFDPAFVQAMSKTVHYPLNLTPFTSWSETSTGLSYTSTSRTYAHPLNATSIVGYDVINDIGGKPVVVLSATMSRDVYQQGLTTLNYVDLSVGASCVLFSAAILLFVEMGILSRLRKLANDVATITSKTHPSAKVKVSGNDAIASLGGSINNMLDEIEKKSVQLRKAERFSAIGELATMVAHDLRNPLQGIANATFYLKRASPGVGAKEMEMLDLIEEDVRYSDKIVNDLLDYSRGLHLELTETNPRQLLKQTLSSISVPANIRVQDETESIPTLKLDVDKVRRTFTNIVNNAIDAMPGGGSLLIRSGVSDRAVDFVFADTGVGMDEKVRQQVFTPLFTTKAKGMGFGLAICKRIIESHGGSISVESAPGKGTTFTISLPLTAVLTEAKIVE